MILCRSLSGTRYVVARLCGLWLHERRVTFGTNIRRHSAFWRSMSGGSRCRLGSSKMDILKNRLPYVWRWLGMAIAIVAIIYLFH
jgi:hypothetical protein